MRNVLFYEVIRENHIKDEFSSIVTHKVFLNGTEINDEQTIISKEISIKTQKCTIIY